jgi:flagellar hook-length control protein FliK
VNSAQLLSASGHSEMRISMDTDKLGAVELRARLVGDQVGAAIMVEKRDAHAALAVELPTLQQALSEKQLRVDQVTLQQGTFSATTGDAGASARQQQHTMPQGPVAVWASETPGVAAISSSATANGIFDSQGRLSVHA